MNSKHHRKAVAAAVIVSLCGLSGASVADIENHGAPVYGPDVFGGYASNQVTIQIRADMVMPVGDAARFGNPVIDDVLNRWNVSSIKPAYPLQFGNPELARRIGLDRYYILDVPLGTNTPAFAAELATHRWVFDYAGLVGIGGTADTFPNDPFFNLCYGQHNTGQNVPGSGVGTPGADIKCPAAWDIWTGDDSITIAVIDSGVWSHVDLAGSLLPGWNTVLNNNDVSDTCNHGTHCAGTAAAVGNNGIGVAGVSWAAKVLPVKVLTGCSGNTTQCANGIIWSADNGADIGTMSLQYYTFDAFHRDSCEYAWLNGTMLIAATGNNAAAGTIAWPARYDYCMGVGATTNRDVRASFSNNGPEIDLCAPGQDVYSLSSTDAYRYLSGTSMATPHVAGLAALLWSYAPGMVPDDLERLLIDTVDDLGATGWDPLYGHGRVNAYTAILQADPGLSITGLSQQPTLIAPGNDHVFTVRIREGNDVLVAGSALLHFRFDGGAFQQAALVHLGGETWEATLPGPRCGTDPEWYVSAEGQTGGVKVLPRTAPAGAWAADVGVIEDFSFFAEGFNAGLPSGWSATGLWNITSQCATPSCDGGTFAYYGNVSECNYRTGSNPNSGTLSSPIINIPSLPFGGAITLTYCSRKNTEVSTVFDQAWITFNGVEVDRIPNSNPIGSWNNRSVDLSAFAGQTGRLEFHFDTVDGNRNLTLGWQIDGINIQKYAAYCDEGCYPDCDQSTGPGVLDIFDFLCFGQKFADNDPYACDCDVSTGPGVCDIFDFLCFGTAFDAGCP